MATPSNMMQGMIDSAMEAVPGQEVDVQEPMSFEGGAEIMDDGAGGAIIQALLGEEGTEVVTEEYQHDANIAEVLDDHCRVCHAVPSTIVQGIVTSGWSCAC